MRHYERYISWLRTIGYALSLKDGRLLSQPAEVVQVELRYEVLDWTGEAPRKRQSLAMPMKKNGS